MGFYTRKTSQSDLTRQVVAQAVTVDDRFYCSNLIEDNYKLYTQTVHFSGLDNIK